MSAVEPAPPLSLALVSLMKGVVYREGDPPAWQALVQLGARVRDHIAPLGLELILDEAEGYAYLRQRQAIEGEPELPRLVPRRQLSYALSLLLALLRKKQVEFDATSSEARLVLQREEIVEAYRMFLPDVVNEARLLDRLDANLNKVVEMGFLRRLRGRDDHFEVSRILKAFVDGQWLGELERRLAEYRAHAEGEEGEPTP